MDAATKRGLARREHHWSHVRIAGWGFIAAAQAVSTAALVLDVPRPLQVTVGALSFLGTVAVAVGYEIILETMHRRTDAHD